MHMRNIFHTAICAENITNSHLCSSNYVLGMEDYYGKIQTPGLL